MPALTSSAPGKIILFGEHAVVYNRPAIAVPISQVKARVIIKPTPQRPSGEIKIQAPAINLDSLLDELSPDHPVASAIRNVLTHLNVEQPPACLIRITSTIPIAAGLGSGAAVSIAIIRAFSGFLGQTLPDDHVSMLAYEVEKIHHGTPSGVDNTVITYNQPVYFRKGKAIETIKVKTPLTFIVADTGITSPTAETVGDVRRSWQADQATFEKYFDEVGEVTEKARQTIEEGKVELLGGLMNENHAWLQKIGVSSQELDHLVKVAGKAGSLGAKLSGGGRGGNLIALVSPAMAPEVRESLLAAGAVHTILTEVDKRNPV
jgi:mevalonate kinase